MNYEHRSFRWLGAERAAEMKEYERCLQRWLSMNSQVWQVPALAMTAQAFLFTIMLSSQTPVLPRLVSAGLAILVSFLCIHAIKKHRHHQTLDYGRMIELEAKWGMPHFAFSGWHSEEWEAKVSAKIPQGSELQLYPKLGSSVTAWVRGFYAFGIVALVVAASSLIWPDLYEQKPAPPTVIVNVSVPTPGPSLPSGPSKTKR